MSTSNVFIQCADFISLHLQVIVDGTYALHAKLRSLLDIRVAVVILFFGPYPLMNCFSINCEKTHNSLYCYLLYQVGGVHFSLLSKVRYDIGDACSLDYLIDSIFPLFRKHIEPDLHHAQVGVFCSLLGWGHEAIFFSDTCANTHAHNITLLVSLIYNSH